jgi:tetratricopeptide (TPR) repeat protein
VLVSRFSSRAGQRASTRRRFAHVHSGVLRALALGILLWLPLPALAQATPAAPAADAAAAQAAHNEEQDRAMQAADYEARQHFQIGKTLLDSGRFQQAAEEFEAAYKLSGRAQLLYNIYIAHRDAGNTQRAVESLRAYLDKVPDAPDRINLLARLSALEEQEKRQKEQEERARKADEDAAKARAEAASRPRTVTEKSSVPWIMMGAGGALVGVSIGTGVAALGKSKKLEDNCFDKHACPASQKGNIDAAKKLSITTDVLWAVGGTAAVTGFVLWVTHALDRERELPAASVAFSPSGVSASLSARF